MNLSKIFFSNDQLSSMVRDVYHINSNILYKRVPNIQQGDLTVNLSKVENGEKQEYPGKTETSTKL